MPLRKRVMLNIAGHYLQSFSTGTVYSRPHDRICGLLPVLGKQRIHQWSGIMPHSTSQSPERQLILQHRCKSSKALMYEPKSHCSQWRLKTHFAVGAGNWFLADNFSQTIIRETALHQLLQHSYRGFISHIKMCLKLCNIECSQGRRLPNRGCHRQGHNPIIYHETMVNGFLPSALFSLQLPAAGRMQLSAGPSRIYHPSQMLPQCRSSGHSGTASQSSSL